MIITVTSMKGGVGKTTIAAMLARFLVDRYEQPTLIVDLDPQGGVSSILLGGNIAPPTIYDVLQLESNGNPGGVLLKEAIRPSRYHEQIFIVPANAHLAALAGDRLSANLLKDALQDASLPEGTHTIVDTGTAPALVALGIGAADVLFVPVMLSQQTARPTIHTLKMSMHHELRRGALIPMGIGKANWELRELERWEHKLRANAALASIGFEVLPSMPYSKAAIHGQWRYGTFPKRFTKPMEAIRDFVFRGPTKNQPSAIDVEHEITQPASNGRIEQPMKEVTRVA